jgi:hypothetical protein
LITYRRACTNHIQIVHQAKMKEQGLTDPSEWDAKRVYQFNLAGDARFPDGPGGFDLTLLRR